jgi:hypothetical protein
MVMPMPPFEAKAILDGFGAEMSGTPAPFYGVNIIDVNKPNLEAYQSYGPAIFGRVLLLPGVSVFHRSMNDYGERLRVLSIVRYDEPVDLDEYNEKCDRHPGYRDAFMKMSQAIEAYTWFTTRDIE